VQLVRVNEFADSLVAGAGVTIPLTTDVFWDQRLKVWFVDAYLSFGVTPNNPAFAGLLKAA